MDHITKSSARILRDVRRMTKFLESKNISVKPMKLNPPQSRLCVSLEVSVDIPPMKKSLAITPRVANHSINPKEGTNVSNKKSRKLSITDVCSTDIPPDPYPCFFCMMVCERPNIPNPKPTDPICCVCRRPIDDRFKPHSCCGLLMHQNCWVNITVMAGRNYGVSSSL